MKFWLIVGQIFLLFALYGESKPWTQELRLSKNGYNKGKWDAVSKALDFKKNRLTTELWVGTPAKKFVLAISTGINEIWLIDPTYPNKTSNQQTYSQKDSSTGRNNSDYREDYSGGDGYLVRGAGFTDKIKTSTSSWVGRFATIMWISGLEKKDYPTFDYDGFIGYGWDATENSKLDEKSSPILQIMNDLKTTSFSIWLQREYNDDFQGQITFGQLNENCAPNPTYFDLGDYGFFQNPLLFYVRAFKMGDYLSKSSSEAMLDTGSAVIGVPAKIISVITKTVNANYEKSLNLYTVECLVINNLPNLEFTIDDQAYPLEPKQYVIDIGLHNGVCILGVDQVSAQSIPAYIFGVPFMSAYCTVFNYDSLSLGLTPSLK